MRSKLKYFYRVDSNGKPVLGSNIKRLKKPELNGRWRELENICCNNREVPCNCNEEFRYWVQLDSSGNPVDRTLIKRAFRPQREGIRFMEVAIENCCVEVIEPGSPGNPLVFNLTTVGSNYATGEEYNFGDVIVPEILEQLGITASEIVTPTGTSYYYDNYIEVNIDGGGQDGGPTLTTTAVPGVYDIPLVIKQNGSNINVIMRITVVYAVKPLPLKTGTFNIYMSDSPFGSDVYKITVLDGNSNDTNIDQNTSLGMLKDIDTATLAITGTSELKEVTITADGMPDGTQMTIVYAGGYCNSINTVQYIASFQNKFKFNYIVCNGDDTYYARFTPNLLKGSNTLTINFNNEDQSIPAYASIDSISNISDYSYNYTLPYSVTPPSDNGTYNLTINIPNTPGGSDKIMVLRGQYIPDGTVVYATTNGGGCGFNVTSAVFTNNIAELSFAACGGEELVITI